MRLPFIAFTLLLLAACAPPPAAPPNQDENAELRKFTEPVNGAPYPQSDVRYYYGSVSSGMNRGR